MSVLTIGLPQDFSGMHYLITLLLHFRYKVATVVLIVLNQGSDWMYALAPRLKMPFDLHCMQAVWMGKMPTNI